MNDIYALLMRGGDGHKFLASLIAHSFLNWNFIPTFPYGNSHLYWSQYITKYLRPKIVYNKNIPVFLNTEPIDSSIPFICLTTRDLIGLIKSQFKNYKLIGITITPDDYIALEANHYLKMWKYYPFNENNNFFKFYLDLKIKDNSLPLLSDKKYFTEVSQEVMVYVFKEYIKTIDFTDDFLKDYTNDQQCVQISFQTLMNDSAGVLSFVENVTNVKRTSSLIETVKKYQLEQVRLKSEFPDFFNLK